jgi:hypothetical protein
MNRNTSSENVGESLPVVVRDLASRSHRLVQQAREGQLVDAGEVEDLLAQIHQTQQAVHQDRQSELLCWLESLQHCLDEVRDQEPHETLTCA